MTMGSEHDEDRSAAVDAPQVADLQDNPISAEDAESPVSNEPAELIDQPETVASFAADGEPADEPPPASSAPRTRREVNAVLVRTGLATEVGRYEAGRLELHRSQKVVVDTEWGHALGTVVRPPVRLQLGGHVRRVVRLANDDDLRVHERNRVRQREAIQFCRERIQAHNLPIRLVGIDLAHSGTRAVFYFTSNDRVDFRTLVKDLARRFHTRIEMRQIGVRDAARHTGGLGTCGRELCCATWLGGFKPISIRMAKDQNLSLNHQKLSGLCGRLRCCLDYEQELYQAQRKGLPKIGKRVFTPQGEGRVKDVNVLRRRVRVQLLDGGYAQFEADEVKRPGDLPAPESSPPSVAEPTPSHPRPSRERHPAPADGRATDQPQPAAAEGASTGEAAGTVNAAGNQPASSPADGSRRGRRRRRRGRRGRNRGPSGGNSPAGGSPPSSGEPA